ncbi:MAG: YbjQ family protein [Caulobacterales bacterium]|nr:YbjQ family protein [Caulobacterales bacterium]
MHLTSQDEFADMEIVQTLGFVKGNVVRARFIVRDFFAGLRMIVGGEVPEYTKLLAESREQAMDRMIAKAEEMGADGVVALRFTTSQVMAGAAEVLVTGTAVTLADRAGARLERPVAAVAER